MGTTAELVVPSHVQGHCHDKDSMLQLKAASHRCAEGRLVGVLLLPAPLR